MISEEIDPATPVRGRLAEFLRQANRDALKGIFGARGERLLWLQAALAIAIGLAAGIWLDAADWFGNSRETHRAVLTFASATFAGSTAIIGAGFAFVTQGIQQRYQNAKERFLAALSTNRGESEIRRLLLQAEYAVELLPSSIHFEENESDLQVDWQACKRAAKDDYLARVYYRRLLTATVSFMLVSFVLLMIESAYNPVELLVAGYFLVAEGSLIATTLTSNKIEDTENLVEVPGSP